jgi:ribosomal-protein-alanine N-acetyltransferase
MPQQIASSPPIIETSRLRLRHMRVPEDVGFVLRLLNDSEFLQHIGDKCVRTEPDARRYIEEGPRASYERLGFGLYTVVLEASGESIGICGLLKRESLTDVDIGYAFLPQFRGKGYAFEAAAAVMQYGFRTLDLPRIIALVYPENERSIRLVEKLGLRRHARVVLAGDTRESLLFGPVAAGADKLPLGT